MVKKIFVQIFVLFLMSASVFAANVPVLDLGSAAGKRGTTVQIPVTLTNAPGVPVAAAGMDILYDTNALELPLAVIGPAGSNADKSISKSTPAAGVLRIGIFGLNNNVIGDGVVAYISFTIKMTSPEGLTILTNTPLAADPDGNDLVGVMGSNGTIENDNTLPEVTINPVSSPTNIGSQIITGMVEAGARVRIDTDTAASDSDATVNNINWSYTITGLVEGSNRITVTASDPAGNTATATSEIILDTILPVVISFSIPETTNSLTILVTSFSVNDNIGITGYQITETNAKPNPTGQDWTTSPSTTYTFTSEGAKTLYAWAKDATGNVSVGKNATVTVDTTAPTVTAFNIPPTYNNLIVPITTFTAIDNIGVAGYMITEENVAPPVTAAGWTAAVPTNYIFTSAGPKTLYAWARDAVGNVSMSLGVSVRIVQDTTPTVTQCNIPSTYESLTVPILAFTATDDVVITGYLLTETEIEPALSEPGWSALPPTSYTFAFSGTKALFCWAKDASGNVSNPMMSNPVIITVPWEVGGNWLMSFSTIKNKRSAVFTITKQASFPVIATGGDFSGSFSLDNTTYTLKGFKNDKDLMVYFTLDIKDDTGVNISTKGRGKGTIDSTGNRIRGDFAYTSSELSLEGIFETRIDMPQAANETEPAILNINQIFERFGCADARNNGAVASNNYYDITINADNTFTGVDAEGTAITNGKIVQQQISFVIGSKSFAGIIQDLDISGVFSDHDTTSSCNTLGVFSGAATPKPVEVLEIVSPALNVLSGASILLPVQIDTGIRELGSFTVTLNYDPTFLSITKISGNPAWEGFSFIPSIKKDTSGTEIGKAIVSGFGSSFYPSGVFNLLEIASNAVGIPGTLGVVSLTNDVLTDREGDPIALNAVYGTDLSIDSVKVYLGGTTGYYDKAPGDIFEIEIIIENAGGRVIGTYDFTLNYDDPAFAYVTEILGGYTQEFASISSSDLTRAQEGIVQWTGSHNSRTSPMDRASVARVKFLVPTATPDQSKTFLTLTVNHLKDANNGQQFSADIFNNVITVSGLCGDVKKDGAVNIIDAMFIAQWTVGNRVLDPAILRWAANTKDDGAVNIIDAMFIAQFTVGNRPSLTCTAIP